MVIELTDGLARCPQDKFGGLSASIENLLIGYYEGNLILMISLPLCAFIRAKGLIKSERAEKALRAIEVGGGFVPAVLWRLSVVLENPNPDNHEVDYLFFSHTLAVQPAVLLCENLMDIKFYMKLVNLYFPYSPIKASSRHGGGGTTVDVFNSLRGVNRICLIVLDSDVKYPKCKIGDTARRCISQYKNQVAHISLKILDVHEAENLVPIEFIKKVASREGKALLSRLGKRQLLGHLVYYDLKSGIKKESLDGDQQYLDYCRDLYDKIYRPRKNTFDLYLKRIKNPDERIFAQMKSDLLEVFVKDKSRAYPDDMFSPKRKSIAELVHTYVCCRGDDPLN